MLHKLLNLTRPLMIFDTETTGLDVAKDRIIELAFQLWMPEGLAKEYRTLVNPGIPIPHAASKVHNITDEQFMLCRTCRLPLGGVCCTEPRGWPTFKQLAHSLTLGFKNCDLGGKNIRFDIQILGFEFERVQVPWSVGDARLVDVDRIEALLNPRSLSHLYKKYTGRELEDAHSAMADVQATTTVLERQIGIGALPTDVAKLHELSFPGMIDVGGKFQFVDGVPCFTRWGKYAGRPMKDADNGYWDYILREGFSSEVKAIAGRAKMKQYPEKK